MNQYISRIHRLSIAARFGFPAIGGRRHARQNKQRLDRQSIEALLVLARVLQQSGWIFQAKSERKCSREPKQSRQTQSKTVQMSQCVRKAVLD